MEKKIVSLVLAVLLIGLFLPGCTSRAELDECKAQVADQAVQIEERDAQIDGLKGRIVTKEAEIAKLKSEIDTKDAQIAELEEEIAKSEGEITGLEAEIECLKEPPPEKVSGDIAGYISYDKTIEVTRKFFPEAGGDFAGSRRSSYPLMSIETLKQFLANDLVDECPPCRPSSYDNCDHLAFRLRANWIEAGLSRWSLHFGKVEVDTRNGRMLCWRNLFLTKEKGEYVFYEVDPQTDKITKIEETSEIEEPSEIYRVIRISDRL